MTEPAPKKRRQPNYTEEELVVTIREVEKRKAVIEGGYRIGVAKQVKRNAWDSVTAAVNSVGGT